MPLIELLRPQQRDWLRKLRKRIANRVLMRRVRADLVRKLLCPGVDLPIEAGTCGRLIAPESSRCIRCHNRRMWLVKYGLNRAEVAVTILLEAAAAEDDARQDAGAAAQMPDAVPLLDDLSVFDPCLRW